MTTPKTNIWPTVSNVLLIIMVIFVTMGIVSHRELQSKLKVSLRSEISLLKEREINSHKIDSLQKEIEIRDSLIIKTQINNSSLAQFKQKYEKEVNRIDIMSIDDNIKFFAKETSN